MRFVSLAIGVLVIAAAFVLGRVTASPQPAYAAGSMAVRTFSHFECYQAKFQGQFSATVELTDQFQQFQTGIGAPQLFCTPVTKKVISGPHMMAPPPANHLTCYAIQGPTIQQTRTFANQFLKGQVQVGTPTLLCVPTNKTG